jgi:hypothetical protein
MSKKNGIRDKNGKVRVVLGESAVQTLVLLDEVPIKGSELKITPDNVVPTTEGSPLGLWLYDAVVKIVEVVPVPGRGYLCGIEVH